MVPSLCSVSLQSSQLLYTLLYHLEDHATHQIRAILSGLYRACQDDERAVVEQVNDELTRSVCGDGMVLVHSVGIKVV